MREIKFRAWHNDYKKMELPEKQLSEDIDYWDGVKGSVLGVINSYLKDDDRVFMQYTGLKDKNGKEIYEGDILVRLYGVKWIVDFTNSGYRAIPHNVDTGLYLTADEFLDCEIIGNIYENSELLKS